MDLSKAKLVESDYLKLEEGENFLRFRDEGTEIVSNRFGKPQLLFVLDWISGDKKREAYGIRYTVTSRSLARELMGYQKKLGGLTGKAFRIIKSGAGLLTKYILSEQSEVEVKSV